MLLKKITGFHVIILLWSNHNNFGFGIWDCGLKIGYLKMNELLSKIRNPKSALRNHFDAS